MKISTLLQKYYPNYKKVIVILLEAFFLFFIALLFKSYINKPFIGHADLVHYDEVCRLKISGSFKAVFIDRDFKNPVLYRQTSIDNPPLGGYIFGAALHFLGVDTTQLHKIKNSKDETNSLNWKLENYGFDIRDKRIIGIRIISAFFGFLSVLVLYLLAKQIAGVITAIIAALYLSYNPLMSAYSGGVGMTDTILMFFWLLSILLIIHCLKYYNRSNFVRAFTCFILASCSITLTIATKLNGVLSLAIFILSISAVFFKEKNGRRRIYVFISMIAMVFLVFGMFTTLYPYLWPSPVSNFLSILKAGHNSVINNASVQTPYALPDMFSTIRSFYDVLFLTIPFFGYYQDPILPLPFTRYTVNWDLLFFISGLFLLFRKTVIIHKKNTSVSPEHIIAIWIAVTFIGIALWIPIRWGRYYLPLLPFISLLIGYSSEILIKLSKNIYAVYRSNPDTVGTKISHRTKENKGTSQKQNN